MENCNSLTLKVIKESTYYKTLPKTVSKSKLKKKELCEVIQRYNIEEPKHEPINKNVELLSFFAELSNIYKQIGERYRSETYSKAHHIIKSLEILPKTKKELMKIKGIGKGTSDKIIEYLETGKILKLNELRESDKVQSILRLTQIAGIGPKKAQELMKKGITNLKELRDEYKTGKVKLSTQQKFGMNHFEDLHKKIPRKEILIFEKKLKKIIKSIDKDLKIEIMGSFRRKKKQSGDVDLLLYHPSVKTKDDIKRNYIREIVEKLSEEFKYIGTLSQGSKKFMGLFILSKLVRHVDILFIPMESIYESINYFTGSKEHNISLREHARKLGYKVNEFGIYKKNQKIPLKSEKHLFDILGLKYIKPKNR